MSRRDPMTHIRIPQEMKDAIAANAKANCRSINSEIVFGLRIYAQTFEQKEKAPDPALESKSDASRQ